MSDPRKQLSVTWLCVAVAVLLPVSYVASLGPLFGIMVRVDEHVPAWCGTAFGYYTAPANLVCDRSPQRVQEALQGYVELFDK